MRLKVYILWNQSNTFGLSQDATLIQEALNQINGHEFEIVKLDPLRPPSKADIIIHLEIPNAVWLPWAPIQIWMVNTELCSSNWDQYRPLFTHIWVKEKDRVAEFGLNAAWIPWSSRLPLKPVTEKTGALWILGGSQQKHVAARALLPIWPSDCPLTVTTSLSKADLSGWDLFPECVTVKYGFLPAEELEALNTSSAIHVAISAAEGFGYTAAQAEARGARLLINTLPVYKEYYQNLPYVSFLETPVTLSSNEHYGYVADFSSVTTEAIRKAYMSDGICMHTNIPDILDYPLGPQKAQERNLRFTSAIALSITACVKRMKASSSIPPVLAKDDCPPISVLTVTYNRRKFIDLAFLNLLVTDYPLSKVQWVIVDDSDDVNEMIHDKIKQFEGRQPGCEITYVPLSKKKSIGYKRNKAVEAAKHDICIHMDDDDVYPETSFRRRVAWLTKSAGVKVVGCTTIAMYDLLKGMSAVNVPPFNLIQNQRVSEASFCFWRSYAIEKPFPDIQTSEGESFVPPPGEFLEIPPQHILIALNHKTNTSGRIIASTKQGSNGCLWGWDAAFIKWVHGLAGVQVVDA